MMPIRHLAKRPRVGSSLDVERRVNESLDVATTEHASAEFNLRAGNPIWTREALLLAARRALAELAKGINRRVRYRDPFPFEPVMPIEEMIFFLPKQESL